MRNAKLIAVSCFCLATAIHLQAQVAGAPAAAPDVLVFTDGEKLIGHLQSANGTSVVFKSDMAGVVTVDWKNIQELRSSQQFATIRKGMKVSRRTDKGTIPQGPIVMMDQQLQVQSPNGAPQSIPVSDVSNVVNETSFQSAFERSGFNKGWKGGATAGISLTEATQKDQTYTAALNMVRTSPGVDWLDVSSRTIFDFNDALWKTDITGLTRS